MEILRRASEYESEFCKGIYYLLKDGCPDINIHHKPESTGPFTLDVYAFNLRYPECRFRTHVYSKLNWSEKSHDEIREKIDLLKQFHIPLLIVFAWNYIPDEVRATLEMHKTSEELISHLCFVLKTKHVYQIIARALAEDRGCQIVESRWRVRASQILDELKFKDAIIEWIEQGIKDGYTLTQLNLAGKSKDDVVKAFRTFLITDGSCEKRYKLLQDFDKRFRIFGKEFPLNPLDISSSRALSEYAQILSENGFLEISENEILIRLTNVEKRILQILRHHNGLLPDDLEKMFVLYGRADLSPYIDILIERKMITKDKTGLVRIYKFEYLENEFGKLQRRISERKMYYQAIPFGCLASIKRRDAIVIDVREYIKTLEDLVSNLEYLKYSSREIWLRKFILFEKLAKHFLDNIDPILRAFIRKFEEKRREIPHIERLKLIVEDVKRHISALVGVAVGKISFKEESTLIKLEREIDEINRRDSFDSSDVRNFFSSIGPKLIQKKEEGLIDSLKGDCYVFDIKMLMLDECYERLRNIASMIIKNKEDVIDKISLIKGLFQQIREHDIFKEEFSQRRTLVSNSLIKAYRSMYESKYPQLLSEEPLIVEEDLTDISMSNLIQSLERFQNELMELKKTLDQDYELIKQVHQLETEFVSLISRLSSAISKLERFYKGHEEMSKRLSLEKESFRQIFSSYYSLLESIEKLAEKVEDTELMNVYNSGITFFRQKINALNRVMNEIMNLFEDSKDEFNTKAEMTRSLLKVLKKSIAISEKEEELTEYLNTFEKRFQEICNEFPDNLNEATQEHFVEGGFMNLLNRLKEMGEVIRNIFVKYELLNEHELAVLETLSTSKVSKINIGLTIPDLIEKTSLDLRQLGEIILKLASIGLISVEVSLTS